MASSLLSSPSLSLSSQFSAIISSEVLSLLISIDPHHFNASISMQLQGSRQQLLNSPEFIDKFGMKRAIAFLIEFVCKVGLKHVSEIGIIFLIEFICEIGFKNFSEIAIIFLTGGKRSNQKCAIDQDSRLIQAVINPDNPEDSVGPFNHVYYNAGNFAAPNHNDAHNVDNHNHHENEDEHGNEDEDNDEEDDEQNEEDNDSHGDVQISKKLEILVYHEEGDIIGAIHTDIIVADLEDWNSLAQRIFELWRQRNDGEAPEISEAINPANCWPGYTTEYIEWSAEDASGLEFFRWGVDSWEDVKDRLNCLEIRPQHKDHDTDQGEEEQEEESGTKRQRVSDQ